MKLMSKRLALGLLMLLSFQSAAIACDGNRTGYPGGAQNYGNRRSNVNLTNAINNLRNLNRNRVVTQPVSYPVYTTQQQQLVARYRLYPLYEPHRFPGHSVFLDRAGGRWEFDAQGTYLSYFPRYAQLKFGTVYRNDNRDDDDDNDD